MNTVIRVIILLHPIVRIILNEIKGLGKSFRQFLLHKHVQKSN